MLRDLIPIRSGEGRPIAWVGAIALLQAAAVGVGDVVAQSIFLERAGAAALPRIFLLKAAIDVGAALLYLPVSRGRHPAAVLRIALLLYAAVVIAGRTLVAGGGASTAYVLYVAHECAWTMLTIHWGVYLLDVFDAGQARRLFPVLFGATRLGGAVAGGLVAVAAVRFGAEHLLIAAAGLAALAALVSFGPHASPTPSMTPALGEVPSESAVDDEAAAARKGVPLLTGWRDAWASPLVRAIATSTALMVLARYALRMVSVGEIEVAFGGDKDLIAEFLGAFDAAANVIGALLGVLFLPRLLARFGIGAVNLAYATATVIAQAASLAAGSLGSAATARFVEIQFKDAVKTPLSALYYGAEKPPVRGPARALVFGAVIPVATVVTGVALELAGRRETPLAAAAAIGLLAGALFVLASVRQNRMWRAQLASLLDWKLARAVKRGTMPTEPALARVRAALAEPFAAASPETRERLEAVAAALASDDRRLRAVGQEALAETIPRAQAHQIARDLEASGQVLEK